MRNAGLEEAQAGIKIAWKNSNNLRYADLLHLQVDSLPLSHQGSPTAVILMEII